MGASQLARPFAPWSDRFARVLQEVPDALAGELFGRNLPRQARGWQSRLQLLPRKREPAKDDVAAVVNLEVAQHLGPIHKGDLTIGLVHEVPRVFTKPRQSGGLGARAAAGHRLRELLDRREALPQEIDDDHHQEDPGRNAGSAQQWTGCAPELLQILASCDVLVDQSLLCRDWRTWQRQQVSPKRVTSCLTNGRVFGHDLGHSAESQASMLQSSLEQQSGLTNAQAGHGVVQREEVQRVLRLVVALWLQVHPCLQVSCSARISGSGPGPRTRAPGEGERRGGVPGA